MDKSAEDLEDPAMQQNIKKLYCYVKKLRASSQSGIVLVKSRNKTSINDKESVQERWSRYFEDVLKCDIVIGNDIEKNQTCIVGC